MTLINEESQRCAYAYFHGATKQLTKMFTNDWINKDEFMRQMNEQFDKLERELDKSYNEVMK